MDKLEKQSLKEVLTSFSSNYDNEAIRMSSLSENLIDYLLENYRSKDCFSHLCSQLNFSQYGISLFLSKAILGKHEIFNLHKDKTKLLVSLIKNYQLIKSNLDSLFTKYETLTCSHDKTRTVLSSYFDYILFDKKIDFNYDQEYTYHLPKKVLKTHYEIIEYISSLYKFFNGNFDNYVKIINNFDKKYL